jgi:hypothetical protein
MQWEQGFDNDNIKKFNQNFFLRIITPMWCGYPDTSVRTSGSESGYQESDPTESKRKQVNVNFFSVNLWSWYLESQ